MPDNARRRRSLPIIIEGGASFSPLDISGLVLWIDFSDITTLYQDAAGNTPVTADGQQIGKAADKSGNGNHATRTPSATVTYETNIKNGLSIARFSGAGGTFVTPSKRYVGADGTWTAIAVSDAANYTAYRGIFNQDDDQIPVVRVAQFLGYVITTGTFRSICFNTALDVFTATYATEKSGFNIAASVRAPTSIQMFVNGDAGTSQAVTGTPPTNTDILTIGAGTQAGATPMIGDIGEILLYSVALSAANRAALETYLNTKWAVF